MILKLLKVLKKDISEDTGINLWKASNRRSNNVTTPRGAATHSSIFSDTCKSCTTELNNQKDEADTTLGFLALHNINYQMQQFLRIICYPEYSGRCAKC